MKTLNPIGAWISILCSILVVSSATHSSSHHNGTSHHGDSSSWKAHHNTTVPQAIQIPEHVLSTRDVDCISTDTNIFEIMGKAQESCKGNDLRCTFYHFVNQGYKKIGTVDVDKKLFDDLLMKFDNWLLTADKIARDGEADGKKEEESVSGLNNVHLKDNVSEKESLHTNHGKHNEKHHTVHETDNSTIHTHHVKKPHESHHKNNSVHGDNYIVKDAEYNKDHRYFEVFLPKDKESGKQKTIYVEVDKDKNEFVLLDKNVHKELLNDKLIKIELDELSEIADTAFTDLIKSSNHTEHHDNDLTDDEKAIVNDISNNSAVHAEETNFDVDVEEISPHNVNSTLVSKIPDDATVNSNVSDGNIVKPNHQPPIIVELHSDNTTDDHLELLESIANENETSHVFESNDNNSNNDLDLDDIEFTYHHTEDETSIINDDSNIELAETHDIGQDFSALDKTGVQTEYPYQKNISPSDYTGSQLDQLETDLHEFSPAPKVPLSTYPTVPILRKELAKVLKTDSHLQESFPANAILDTSSNSDLEHPSISSYTSAKDSSTAPVFENHSVFPASPVERRLRLKASDDLPLNVGFTLLPSYSRIEKLHLPSPTNPQDCITPLPNRSKEFSGSLESTDGPVLIEDQSLSSFADQEMSISPEPFHLHGSTVIVPEHSYLPSQLPNTFDRIAATSTLRENPLSVPHISTLNPPVFIQQNPQPSSYFPTYNNLEYMKQLPFDATSGELSPILEKQPTIIPFSPYRNSPYSTFPYTANPYLKPPYLGSLLPVTSRPISNSLPLSSDQTYSCTNGDYPQETKPITLPPYTPCSPLNPHSLGPSFYPKTLSPYLWNSIPYYSLPSSPYTMIPNQGIRNYPPTVINNYSPDGLIENKVLRPSPSNHVPSSYLDQPCSPKSISPVPTESNPSLSLERDLQLLSLKYDIPFTNMLQNIGTDSDDEPCQRPLAEPYSKEWNTHVHTTNGAGENRPWDKDFVTESDFSPMTPLDTFLKGPHLNMESPLWKLESNAQFNTDSSKPTVPLTPHTGFKRPATILDSSLTGSHLSTTNSFSEGNQMVQTESDSCLTPLDSSLIGPHLELGSPPVIVDLNKSPSKTLSAHPKDELGYSETVQYKKPATALHPVDKLHGAGKYLFSNVVGSELDSSNLIPLDSSLIGPHSNTGNSQTTINDGEYIPLPIISQDTLPNKNIKNDELESIILPPSLLPSLLNPHAKADLNLNTRTQNTKLNGLTDISIKERDGKIIETLSNLTPIGSKVSHLSPKDSKDLRTTQHKITSSEMSDYDYVSKLDSSLTGLCLRDIMQTSEKTNSLKGPSFKELQGTSSNTNPAAKFESSFVTPGYHKPSFVSDSKIRLDPSLIGPSLHHGVESLKGLEPHVVDAQYHVDSSLIGPSLSTIALSDAEIKMINEELQSQSFIPLDSSLIGPSLNFQRGELLPNTYPMSVCKSQPFFPKTKLPNLHMHLNPYTCSNAYKPDFQTSNTPLSLEDQLLVSEFDPIREQELTPIESANYGHPCSESNYILTPKSLAESLSYAQGFPYKPITPFLQMNPMMHRWQVPQPLNFQNILQTSSGLRPMLNCAPYNANAILPLTSNAESIVYPGLFTPEINTPLSPTELASLANVLPSKKYISSLPKNPPVIPSLEPSVCESGPNPIIQDDIMSLLDEETIQLLKDLSALGQSSPTSVPGFQKGVAPSLVDKPILNADYTKTYPDLPVPNTKPMMPSPIYNPPQDIPYTVNKPNMPSNLHPYPQELIGPQLPEMFGPPPELISSSSPIYNPPKKIPYMAHTPNMPSNFRPYPQELIGPQHSEVFGPPPELISSSSQVYNPPKKIPYMAHTPNMPSNFRPYPQELIGPQHSEVFGPPPELISSSSSVYNSPQNIHYMTQTPNMPSNFRPYPQDLIGPQLPEAFGPPPELISSSSPIYNAPQNIPYTIHKPNMPSNFQPYPTELIGPQLSEIFEPPPELISLPAEHPKTCLEPQLQEIPQLIDSITDSTLDNDFLQQLLSEPCLEPLTGLPSSSPVTKPPVSCPIPVFFPPISSIYTTPLSNAFKRPISPIYSLPSYAKPISTSTTGSPSNAPYLAKPFAPSPLPTYPYPPSLVAPDFTSPLIPTKTTPDYLYSPKTTQYRPMPPAAPYKPFGTYSRPYSPVPPKPQLVETNPCSFKTMSEPVSSPIYGSAPKSPTSAYTTPLTPPFTNQLLSTPTELLSTYPSPTPGSYRPSNLSPSYLNPVSPQTSSLPFKRPSPPNLNLQLTMAELQLLKLLNTLPNSNAGNQYLKPYQKPNPKIPLQSYSQTKEDTPCSEAIKSNLQPARLTEELPSFIDPEEMVCTCSNDEYYEGEYFKCPLESLSCTLEPEEIDEVLPEEDLPCTPEICLGIEPELQYQPYQSPDLIPYTPQNGQPLRPCLAEQSLLPLLLIDPIQETFDNLPVVPPYKPLKVLPAILNKPLLQYPVAQFLPLPPLLMDPVKKTFANLPLAPSFKPLKVPPTIHPSMLYTPSIPAPNRPSSLPLLPNPCTDISVSPYNIIPISKKPILSSPYYSATSQNVPSLPFAPKRLGNVISPYLTSDFSQVPLDTYCMGMPSPISRPAPQLPTVLYIPDNFNSMPHTYIEPQPKTSPSQGFLRPLQPPLSHQYITPLEVPIPVPSLKKIKPEISPKYIPSILPTEYSPLNEIPTHYQSYIPLSPAFTCPAKNVFKRPSVTTPYTELPSLNNKALPSKSPQWSSYTPQYSLPASAPKVPISNVAYSEPTLNIAKQPMTNHILPSSLFFIPERDQTPTNKLYPPCNIPRFSLPSLALPESLVKAVPAQPIIKPKPQSPNGQYAVPLSSLPYQTQPLQTANSYPFQPLSNVPCITQLASPISSERIGPCPVVSYASSPLQKLPYRPINEPVIPQFSLPSTPIKDLLVYSSSPVQNPFINPDLKSVSKPPLYQITNDCIAPLNSIILSNILKPLDICPKPLNSYSSSMTSPVQLSSPTSRLAETFPQKSHQFEPYINSNPHLLPSTIFFLESPLLKPLLSTSQNNAPLLPIPQTAFKPVTPKKFLSPVPINDKYISLPDSHVSVVANLESMNPSPHFNSLRPLLNKYQSPISSPSHSNYNIPARLSPKANLAKPVTVSAISPSESPLLSAEYLVGNYSPLPISCSQVRPYLPILKPRYSSKPPASYTILPLQKKFSTPSQYPTKTVPLLNAPALSCTDQVELIDESNFIPIQSEPLIPRHFPTVIPPIYTTVPSRIPSYTNTDFSSPAYKQLPFSLPPTPRPQSPIYLTPQEYEELTQSPSISYPSSPSSTSPISGPQLPRPLLDCMTWLQSPPFTKSLPFEQPIEVKPETESLPINFNNYNRPLNKFTPLEVYNYLNEPELSKSEVPLKMDTGNQIAPANPLFKLEPYTEYTEALNSNYYDLDCTRSNKNKPEIFKARPFTKGLPEFKGTIFPYYNKIVPRPQRIPNLDHFYENNHIGARPQVCTAPAKKLTNSNPDITSPCTTAFPDISTYFEPVPNLDTSFLRPNECYPEILDSSSETPAIPISSPGNYRQPYLEPNSQMKYSPATMAVPETAPCNPYNNIQDIKYSGYKTYQIPSSFKSPQMAQNLLSPLQMYPNPGLRFSDNPSKFLECQVPKYQLPMLGTAPEFQTKSALNPLQEDSKFYEPQILQYQSPILRTAPLQTKSDLNPSQESPEFFEPQSPIFRTEPLQTESYLNPSQEDPKLNEDNTVEIPISTDNINEDNELKTSLINYINKKESLRDNKNDEITVPLGNIAIIKKEPSNANTIQTNNPSIGLKVWKSNLKIAQAELKLKFKDLSVKNFMPVVNNLNKYDIEEIRKLVKNYIDEKYGNHIEVKEPYIIDNKYTIIEDFDHNATDNKFNLLWPTNYV